MALPAEVKVRALAVIPARWASSRFPGKPLALLGGQPLVQHVVEAALNSRAFERVSVATDDERTSSMHRSGTDRVAEVVARLPAGAPDVVVNLQGDEPLLEAEALLALVNAFQDDQVAMATLVRPLADEEERTLKLVVPPRYRLRGDARVYPIAIEIRLPGDSAGGAG